MNSGRMEQSLTTKDLSDAVLERPESFRASCDNCAKSKVRCGKEQPRCQRCIYQGGRCIYSPSQRARKRRTSSDDRVPQHEPGPTPARSVPSGNPAPLSPPQSEGVRPSIVRLSSQGRSTDTNIQSEIEGIPEHHHDEVTALNLFDTDLDGFMKLGYPIPQLDRLARRGGSILPDHLQTQPWLHHDQMEVNSLEDDDMGEIFSLPDDHFMEPCISDKLLGSSGNLDTTTSQAAHQHWPSLAFSTLQSVDIATACCSSFTLKLYPSSTSGSSRSLDTVLRINQAAIDNVLTILNCPCTADTNLALLVTIIVFKILSWYEASLNCSRSSGDSSMTGSASANSPFASSCGTHEGSPATGAESVFMPPITIGAYKLDDEHRGRMIAQLILTELVKLTKVVDGFSRKYGRSRPMSTEGSRNQLHFALEMFLRSRVKMAVHVAREQLDKN